MKKRDIGFMKDSVIKKSLNRFSAIAVGAITGVIIFIPLIWIGYGIKTEENRKSFAILAFFILIFLAPLLAAGWVTAILSPKYYVSNTAITGLSLFIFLLINNDFKDTDIKKLVILFLIIPVTIVGGIIGLAVNKNRKLTKKIS